MHRVSHELFASGWRSSFPGSIPDALGPHKCSEVLKKGHNLTQDTVLWVIPRALLSLLLHSHVSIPHTATLQCFLVLLLQSFTSNQPIPKTAVTVAPTVYLQKAKSHQFTHTLGNMPHMCNMLLIYTLVNKQLSVLCTERSAVCAVRICTLKGFLSSSYQVIHKYCVQHKRAGLVVRGYVMTEYLLHSTSKRELHQ